MSFPNTLTIFINTRIRGYPKIKYEPDMTVSNIKSETVYFNPLIKLDKSTVNSIPSGYPQTEKYTQFFNKNDFNSLVNRSITSNFQKRLTLEEATKGGIVDNNISVTLDTLFRKNANFYIRGKPYTIYSHEWINGDWQIDTKSFEKNILSSTYGQGLYGAQQNAMIQNRLAMDELKKFKLEHSGIVQGFAVSTDMSKFNDEYTSDLGKGVSKPKTPAEVAASAESLKQWGKEEVPKIARKLATKQLVYQTIVNLDEEANLSNDPISLNILYSVDRNYSEDIKLNRKILEPLYQDLLQKGEQYKIIKDKYDKSVGTYRAITGNNLTTPVAVRATESNNLPVASVATKGVSENTQGVSENNIFKNKKNYDDTVEKINQFIDQLKKQKQTYQNIIANPQIKNQLIQIIILLETYKTQFLNTFLETLKLLVSKINVQMIYIIALYNFYSQLYISKQNYFKSQNTENNHQNILVLNMIKFDVQCYKNIMSNMDSNANKELSNNFISLKSCVLIVEKFIQKNKAIPKNYTELLMQYYNNPRLLRINRYQFDIYMFSILKYDQIIDLGMWKILYRQTDVFLNNIKETIIGKTDGNVVNEGKLSVARSAIDQYNEKYTQQQRDALVTNISKLNQPLQEQTQSSFDFQDTKNFKQQKNDYIRMQTTIVLCYDLITIYSKISAIKYSREISLVTTRTNLGNIINKIFERTLDCYNQILKDNAMIPFIPDYLFWDSQTYKDAKSLSNSIKITAQVFKDNKNKTETYKLLMKSLKLKYFAAVDLLIPQISKLGILKKCRQIVENDEDSDSDDDSVYNDDDEPLTPGEKLTQFFLREYEKNLDSTNSILLRGNISFLYDDGVRDGVVDILPNNEIVNIIDSWNIIDNAGGGDCLFLAASMLFNNDLINNGKLSNNPFANTDGFYSQSSLRQAIADPTYGITNEEIARWDDHRNIAAIDVDDPATTPDDIAYKREFSFLLDDDGNWIGDDPEAVRDVIRQNGKYWGDQTSIFILERIFEIKFIIIDTTTKTPFPQGTTVRFITHAGINSHGVVKSYALVAGTNEYLYEIEDIDYITHRQISSIYNNITASPSGNYRVVPSNANEDIANDLTHFAFILLTVLENGVQHWEIMNSTIDGKFIYTFAEIPNYLKYLIFKTQWKFANPATRIASWFGHNNEFNDYLEVMQEHYEHARDNSPVRLENIRNGIAPALASDGPTAPIGPRRPFIPPVNPPLKKKKGKGLFKKGGGFYEDEESDESENILIGGQINSRNRYVNINRPNTSFDDSKLSYYVVVDLELYPGESIPLLKQPVIACNLRYEKIRQAFADMFGLVYQPLDFYQRGHVAPSSVKYIKSDDENGPQEQSRYDTRRYRPYYGGMKYGGMKKNKTRRVFK